MKLTIANIRWITDVFELWNLNIFNWSNWSGKSTVIQIIKEMLWWKTTIKKGEASLEIDWKIISLNNWILFNSPWIKINELWFLSGKGKQVKWYNSTKQDKRNTVFELLWIEQMQGDISWLTWELKTLKTKENLLIEELMELEEKEYAEIPKPKEVKLINWTEGNKYELDNLKETLNEIKIINLPEELDKPKEVKLNSSNIKELELLKTELESIKQEGINIPESCDKCWQVIVNREKMKEVLRAKYTDLANKINSFNLIESNQDEYEKYRDELLKYQYRLVDIQHVKDSNLDKNKKIQSINKKIEEFKLIKSTDGNQDEYEEYQLALRVYESNKQNIETKDQSIKLLKEKIKVIPTIEVETKIKKYRKDELEFNKKLEWLLTLGDIKIITSKQLKSPNVSWEMFASDFRIEYKGKEYDECSSWEQIMIDIKVNEILFKDSEYILIDTAEISTENLKKAIKDIKNKKIFTTRISKWDLKISSTF